MPRVNLTDEEAEIIEARRRRNTAGIAHNRAIDIAVAYLKSFHDAEHFVLEDVLFGLENLKEPLRN